MLSYWRKDIIDVINYNRQLALKPDTQGKKGKRPWEALKDWEGWHMGAIFGLLPTFLFTIVSGGVICFFLVMKAYENAVALAGLSLVGLGMLVGGVGWLKLLSRYMDEYRQDGSKKEAPGPAGEKASAAIEEARSDTVDKV